MGGMGGEARGIGGGGGGSEVLFWTGTEQERREWRRALDLASLRRASDAVVQCCEEMQLRGEEKAMGAVGVFRVSGASALVCIKTNNASNAACLNACLNACS